MRWFPIRWMLLVFALLILVGILVKDYFAQSGPAVWAPPVLASLGTSHEDSLIRYGSALFINTSYYLGPKGNLGKLSNGMNCQNCHEAGGTKLFSNCLNAVASTYPKYRDRSGRVESVSYRVNECLERSLNGTRLDTNSREMMAIVDYLNRLGKEVPKGSKPIGAGTVELAFLERPADPKKGMVGYMRECAKCHTGQGTGLMLKDSSGYLYPPLWGDNSFNTAAGMFRLTKLAAFIKNNMPFGTSYLQPVLTDEEAWDIASYIIAQKRPEKYFAYDWKDISKKPVDYPFAPFIDSFSAEQHKYGPFKPIIAAKKPQ